MADTSRRGFASMDEEKRREIARKGGESVPAEKRSFSKDPELASEAGRKDGQGVPDEKRSFSQDPELASEAGRKGASRHEAILPTILNGPVKRVSAAVPLRMGSASIPNGKLAKAAAMHAMLTPHAMQ